MVHAWIMDDDLSTDFRTPHKTDPVIPISLEELYKRTGVEYFAIDTDNLDTNQEYTELKKKRGYTYEDCCEISRDTLPDYDNKLKSFFTEHIHSDEEIRLIMAGSGYFDVRNEDDRWIRIACTKNDLLVLPAGIYHRFILDTNDYIKAKRLFVGEPVWTPINRPEADQHVARINYINKVVAP